MSQALQFFRDGYRDQSVKSLKEWVGPNGTMGVYISQDYGYIYLLVLVDAEKRVYYQQQYVPHTPINIPLKDAEVIAAFAGAQEVQNDVPD